jgi:hypothetical protein
MTERPRRRRPAAGARVLVSGLSVSTLLGMVGGLVAGDHVVNATATEPQHQPSPAPTLVRVVVRVHHPPARGTTGGTVATAPPAYVVPPPQPPAPRRVYVHRTPAPVTTSHGSR